MEGLPKALATLKAEDLEDPTIEKVPSPEQAEVLHVRQDNRRGAREDA
jgi:hypothetical protein